MKSSTKYFVAFGVSALGFSAMAQAPFVESGFQGFPQIHRTTPVAADFSNNGKFDVYHGGQLDPDLEKPGIWNWTQTSTMIYNLGDDMFDIDKWTAERNEEPNKDEEGNIKYDAEGNPEYSYHMAAPKHNIRVSSENTTAAIDYNNDGLVDLIQFGWNGSDDWTGWGDEWKTNHMSLYKNNGDGTFTFITEAGFPNMRPDNSGTPIGLAIGDYDRDGFVDILVSATSVDRAEGEELMPGRAVNLYRNLNGTGKFEKMLIADVKGGVWTNEAKDGDEVITPRTQLEGWFAPISGNVIFADINNDGWLDIINSGWADDCHMGDRVGGARTIVYLNRNGEKFEDVTATMSNLRSAGTAVFDYDADGYLDYFFPGYSDSFGGWGSYIYSNNLPYDEDENAIFADPLDGDTKGIKGNENCHPVFRDFNGDGIYDLWYNDNEGHIDIYWGDNSGSFSVEHYEDLPADGIFGCAGDFNNDGMTDVFQTGYCAADRLYYNTAEAVEAPAAPENVSVTYAEGKLQIAWEYDEATAIEDAIAYNVYVKNANGIYSLLPADIETGFIKVAEGKHVALRPNVMEYSIKTDLQDAEVGVQAISLKNETYSQFAKAATTGVANVAAEAKTLKVNVTENGILVAGNGEAVSVYNALGQKVAAGVAGEAIAVEGNGIFVVATAAGSAKIVK